MFPLIIGGSVFRLVEKRDVTGHFFESYFDFVLKYEGEAPLVELLNSDHPFENPTNNRCLLGTVRRNDEAGTANHAGTDTSTISPDCHWTSVPRPRSCCRCDHPRLLTGTKCRRSKLSLKRTTKIATA